LIYSLVNGKLKAVQTGIVAAGHTECGRGITGYPGIYTDVPFYMSWILENLTEN
jgi:secreted trypsin-like serine protease